jgi:hypothetical protein
MRTAGCSINEWSAGVAAALLIPRQTNKPSPRLEKGIHTPAPSDSFTAVKRG